MTQQLAINSSLDRSSVACRVNHPSRVAPEKQRILIPALHLHNKALPYAERQKITDRLSFLKPYQNSIHSIVLVGSTAYSAQTSYSDIDIVIITTTGGHEKVCSVVFEDEIDASLNSGKNAQFEYTVLTSRQTEELFQISSPFSYSIRHGVVIQDDGYLLLLRNKRFPLLPEKKYYTTCLYENIATQYYGLLKKLHCETRQKGCSSSCSKKNRGCEGLQPAHLFAKLIMRMLYVTLPSRGMVPLTKTDVVTYAKKAYGSHGENVAKQVISLLREKESSFCFDEWTVLKKFGVRLFKEILSITGLNNNVRDIIVDAARIARGDFHLIQSSIMKNCVV